MRLLLLFYVIVIPFRSWAAVETPVSPDSVMAQIIKSKEGLDVLQAGVTKLEARAFARSYMRHLNLKSGVEQLETLLGHLKNAKAYGVDDPESHEGKAFRLFLRAVLQDRPAWEALFEDQRPMRWGTVGESAACAAYFIAAQDPNYTRSFPAFGGPKLIAWVMNALSDYWDRDMAIPPMPDGTNLGPEALNALRTAVLKSRNREGWLQSLSLEEALALSLLAKRDPEILKVLRPIVDRIDLVEADVPASATVTKLRSLKGKLLTVDLLLELISWNLEEDLDISLERPEAPGPITMRVNRRKDRPGNREITDRFLMLYDYDAHMDRMRIEPMYIGPFGTLRDSYKEAIPTVREIMGPSLGERATNLGFFSLEYRLNPSELYRQSAAGGERAEAFVIHRVEMLGSGNRPYARDHEDGDHVNQ